MMAARMIWGAGNVRYSLVARGLRQKCERRIRNAAWLYVVYLLSHSFAARKVI